MAVRAEAMSGSSMDLGLEVEKLKIIKILARERLQREV
jgi:hypothetical protein